MRLGRLQRSFSSAIVSDKVLYHVKGDHIIEIELNKPKALNALDQDMVDSMHQKLKHWKKSGHPRVVIIKGSGEKAFCAGGDIVSIYNAKIKGENPFIP